MTPFRILASVVMMVFFSLPALHTGATISGLYTASIAAAAEYGYEMPVESLKGGLPGERDARIAADNELRSRIIDITYASLAAAASAGRLIPEQRYRIFDFRTVHQIRETNEYHHGPVEPLIVRASTATALYPQAISELHPNDIIHYSIENWAELYGSETGQIHYREDPDLDIWAHQDWRNWICRWWETEEGSGVFDSPRGGFAFRDYPMFNPDLLVRGGYNHIHIGDQNWLDPDAKFSTNVVFRGRATKVTMASGTDPWIFLSPDAHITNVTIKDCSSGVAYAGMDTVTFGQNCKFNEFHGDVRDTSIGDGCRGNIFVKDLTSSMIGSGSERNRFEGNVHGSLIMPGTSEQIFTSDRIGQIIMQPPPAPDSNP